MIENISLGIFYNMEVYVPPQIDNQHIYYGEFLNKAYNNKHKISVVISDPNMHGEINHSLKLTWII